MHRRLSGALLISTVLHAGVLLALLAVRHAAAPAVVLPTPQVLYVDLLWLAAEDGASGEQDEGTGSDAVADPDPDPGDPLDDPGLPETAVAVVDQDQSPGPADAESPELSAAAPAARSSAVAPTPSPAPSFATSAEPDFAAADTARPPTETTAPPERRPDTADGEPDTADPQIEWLANRDASPATARNAVEAAPSAHVEPLAEVVTMAPAQEQMLEQKLAQWADHFDDRDRDGTVAEWEHDGQAYTATFTRLSPGDATGLEQIVVEVGTQTDRGRLSASMRLQRLAFSHYAQLIDWWDPSVRLHDDEVNGRFHANSEIFVSQTRDARPTFHGAVTTARRVNTSYSERRVRHDQVFLGGLETGVGRITLPRRFELADDDDRRPDNVHSFENDTRIAFHADGTYQWSDLNGARPAQRRRLPDEAFYLLAEDKAALHVHGRVRGQVLVYSPVLIVIEGDLTYASDPAHSGIDDGDFLALVSDRNVEIADARTVDAGDLSIHASIYAKRRFAVRRFRSRHQGTLFIYGSLAAGTVSATEPRYRTHVQFDPRLEHRRAPGFPMTDRYAVTDWESTWTVERPGLAAQTERLDH